MARALLDIARGGSSRRELREPRGSLVQFSYEGEGPCCNTIAVILLIMWLLGMVSGYTIGAFIHVLLVVALVLFLAGLLSGRRLV
jgi:hypothetical protein